MIGAGSKTAWRAAFALLVLLCAGNIRANVLVGPSLKLEGETVYAKIDGSRADLSGVYEFSDWTPTDALYLPLFSDGKTDRRTVLREARISVRIGSESLSQISLATPPPAVWTGGPVPGLIWAKIGSNDEAAIDLLHSSGSKRISVNYVQELVDGKLLYLPTIPNRETITPSGRPWPYQLVVRNTLRIPVMVSEGVDYDQVGEALVVYLRNQQSVKIK